MTGLTSTQLRSWFVFLVSGAAALQAASAPACTAFVDVTVIPMDRDRTLTHQTVVVREQKIASVGPAISAASHRGCSVIDGRERFLIPGLVDSHIHFFGYRKLREGDPKVQRAILTMLLANGVTTAVVMEGTPSILTLRQEIQDGHLSLPALYVAGSLIQRSGSGGPPDRKTFDTPSQVRAEVMSEKRAGYDFVKVHGDLSPETYQELLETARETGIPVVGHVPPNLGIGAVFAGGQKLITHAESYLDGYFRFQRELPRSTEEIDSMVKDIATRTAKAGLWVQPTLSVFRQINSQIADVNALLERPEMKYLPDSATADWKPPLNPYVQRWKLENIPEFRHHYLIMQRLTKGLSEAGVPLLAGTDDMVPCQLPGFSLRDELEQLNEAGLTPFQALETATSNAARFLQNFDKAGTIRAGQEANLVLLSANPVENINNIALQLGVMLRGTWFSEAQLQRRLQDFVTH